MKTGHTLLKNSTSKPRFAFKYNSEQPPPPVIVAENVVRLSITEGFPGSIGPHLLSKFFPNVRHLVLLHPRDRTTNDTRRMHTQLPALLNDFCSLESLELGDVDELEEDSRTLIPSNVKALRMRSIVGDSPPSTTAILSTFLHHAMANLTVLEIEVTKLLEPSFQFDHYEEEDKQKILSTLCQAITALPKLEILITQRLDMISENSSTWEMNSTFAYRNRQNP